jgi:hypothetical protein
MIKQIILIALVAIGVTALFFGASIASAQAQSAAEQALRRSVPPPAHHEPGPPPAHHEPGPPPRIYVPPPTPRRAE